MDVYDEDKDVVQEGVSSKIHRGFTLKTGGKSKTPAGLKSKTPAGLKSKTPVGTHSINPVQSSFTPMISNGMSAGKIGTPAKSNLSAPVHHV